MSREKREVVEFFAAVAVIMLLGVLAAVYIAQPAMEAGS